MNPDDEPAQSTRCAGCKIPWIVSGMVVILDHDPVMVEIHAGNFIYGPLLVETALDWLTIQETEGFNVIGCVQQKRTDRRNGRCWRVVARVIVVQRVSLPFAA